MISLISVFSQIQILYQSSKQSSQPLPSQRGEKLSIHLSGTPKALVLNCKAAEGALAQHRKGTKLVQQVEQHQELVFHHLRQQRRGFLQVLHGVKLLCNVFFYFWSSSSYQVYKAEIM